MPLGAKYGGRSKGTPNKVKEKDLRDFLQNEVSGGKKGYLRRLYDTIMEVEAPDRKAKLMMEFLEFWMPKLKAIDMKHELNDEAGKILIAYSQAGQKALSAVVDDSPRALDTKEVNCIEGEVAEESQTVSEDVESDD